LVEKKVMEVVDFGDDEEEEEGGDGVLKRREMEMVEVVVGDGGEEARPGLKVSLPAMRLEHRRRWPVEGVGWAGWVRSPDEEEEEEKGGEVKEKKRERKEKEKERERV